MAGRTLKKYLVLSAATLLICGFLYQYRASSCQEPQSGLTEFVGPERFVIINKEGEYRKFTYNRLLPFIFIGGMPRSGTTLLRVMLDAHPEIRCGEETRVIPRILGMRQQWMRSPFESNRLKEAGITSNVLDSAIAAFIMEIIVKHGFPSPRLCNKDPFTLRSAVYLKQLFPNSKFVFMIRDGRAVVHSIITRKVTITGFDLKDPQLGPSVCLPLHYEKLVLNPKFWLQKLLSFLDVPWNDSVLNHERFINKPGGISLSKLERSTDQVIKPVNIEALSKWVGQFPPDVIQDMPMIAPMLTVLGYDPNANPPDYGKPDSMVLQNMKELENNKELWKRKETEMIEMRENIRRSLVKPKNKDESDNEIIQSLDSERKSTDQQSNR
ncbi:protein-tyrosine sulfotransferase 2-like protein [Dinothrombium tinctorium]|uniref:Protein-tyrosine sulfotransferase n=1 Tax=Dinothrombium tinctorium TaxID=1965070 RepID=A0A443R158_9ACAR|nr:protein-tyrosine sulfotransferase 2-like protein [Dinothrombium tinctorium]